MHGASFISLLLLLLATFCKLHKFIIEKKTSSVAAMYPGLFMEDQRMNVERVCKRFTPPR